MYKIAKAISLAISDFDKNKDKTLEIVEELCNKYPLYNGGVLK